MNNWSVSAVIAVGQHKGIQLIHTQEAPSGRADYPEGTESQTCLETRKPDKGHLGENKSRSDIVTGAFGKAAGQLSVATSCWAACEAPPT